jgi:hypothetical protein
MPSPGTAIPGGSMPDLAYVLATLVFFAVAWGYALVCDRL